MKRTLLVAALLGILAGWMLTGCDTPPGPPRTADWSVPKVLTVPPGNEVEREHVVDFETARVNYEYRLKVLKEYFRRTGQVDRHEWAGRELKNLRQSRTFEWQGIPEVVPPEGESIEGADARMLAELVVGARREYLRELDKLLAYYRSRDAQSYKAQRIANLRERFDPVRTYMYFLDAEIPGPDLEPTEVIPAATELYNDAIRLYREGQIAPAITDYDKERQALVKLRTLVREYPQSMEIALAAFYIAEIYKEYFNEYVRSVHWYERAWQWDPNITRPARYQAALIYDLHLKSPAKAVELYRASIQHDPDDAGRDAAALRRIKELTRPREGG